MGALVRLNTPDATPSVFLHKHSQTCVFQTGTDHSNRIPKRFFVCITQKAPRDQLGSMRSRSGDSGGGGLLVLCSRGQYCTEFLVRLFPEGQEIDTIMNWMASREGGGPVTTPANDDMYWTPICGSHFIRKWTISIPGQFELLCKSYFPVLICLLNSKFAQFEKKYLAFLFRINRDPPVQAAWLSATKEPKWRGKRRRTERPVEVALTLSGSRKSSLSKRDPFSLKTTTSMTPGFHDLKTPCSRDRKSAFVSSLDTTK